MGHISKYFKMMQFQIRPSRLYVNGDGTFKMGLMGLQAYFTGGKDSDSERLKYLSVNLQIFYILEVKVCMFYSNTEDFLSLN